MRPLRLSITAFGPYPGTEVIDFDALAGLGLFVVAGNNGSGKTTIFDALHYALYGSLPGRRAKYGRLKSDHAEAAAECSVTLDFAAQGEHWRVTRTPAQTRPKRRGSGTTEAKARAVLYRFDDNEPVAVTSRLEEVREQCTQLVGLSGRQFERVALLPQGEFSRVLRESSTERRELLRTLFSSEIFDDATTLLTDQAKQAASANHSVLARLDHQQQTLADELGDMLGDSVAATLDAMAGAIADINRSRITPLQHRVNGLERHAAQATTKLQSAVDIAERLGRRDEVARKLDEHLQLQPQYERDRARLQRARAAVPVVGLIRAAHEQQQRRRSAESSIADIGTQLNRALDHCQLATVDAADADLEQLGADVEAVITACNERRNQAAIVRDLNDIVTRLQADSRRGANEIAQLREQREMAASQQRQVGAELTRLEAAGDPESCERTMLLANDVLRQRHELTALDHEHGQLVARVRELDERLDQLQSEHDDAIAAQATAHDLATKATAATDALNEVTERLTLSERFRSAMAELGQSRAELQRLQLLADQQWHAFIAGTALRVAQTLVDDDPCPVCGSCEHPAPATASDDATPATEDDVTASRNAVEQQQQIVRRIESVIEQAREQVPEIASLDPTELLAESKTAKAMALGARQAADSALGVARRGQQLGQRIQRLRAERADTDRQANTTNEQRNLLQGALGANAKVPVESLQSQANAAQQAFDAATEAIARHDQIQRELAEINDQHETLGLEIIAAERRHQSVDDQLDQRQLEHTQALTALQTLDNQLGVQAVDGDDAGSAPSFERHAQAARHAVELCAALAKARAVHGDTTENTRRAESLLADRLGQSIFTSVDDATAAFAEPTVVEQLDAQVSSFEATRDRLQGQLHELAGLPDAAPNVSALQAAADAANTAHAEQNRELIALTTRLERCERDLAAIVTERNERARTDGDAQRLERVAALVRGDNERNTSLENWVLAAHLRDVVELANIRLAQSTHQRFQLCVLDDGESRRGTWGLDLGVEDTVTGTQRPTAGLSGGELFQASLALALGLADAVMNQRSGVRIDALFIDEGFGSLDETSVERAIDLLDELRDRGAMVGVITHVPALLDALPLGVSVIDAPSGVGSTTRQRDRAA